MTTIKDVMSADLIHVEAHDTVTTAAAIMDAARVGAALVMEGEALQGIFTERDVLRALKRDPHGVLDSPVGDWMTNDPMTVAADAPVMDALRLMLRGGFRHLPVVDDERLVGIVSLRDLARALAEEG
ncbi:MAG TPA: CBS domain-containing protein [Actinomycetota bacterium]